MSPCLEPPDQDFDFMDFQLVLFALLLALAFANGTNDVSKAIATLVGSGITKIQSKHVPTPGQRMTWPSLNQGLLVPNCPQQT
jgi:hypothetical protein